MPHELRKAPCIVCVCVNEVRSLSIRMIGNIHLRVIIAVLRSVCRIPTNIVLPVLLAPHRHTNLTDTGRARQVFNLHGKRARPVVLIDYRNLRIGNILDLHCSVADKAGLIVPVFIGVDDIASRLAVAAHRDRGGVGARAFLAGRIPHEIVLPVFAAPYRKADRCPRLCRMVPEGNGDPGLVCVRLGREHGGPARLHLCFGGRREHGGAVSIIRVSVDIIVPLVALMVQIVDIRVPIAPRFSHRVPADIVLPVSPAPHR